MASDLEDFAELREYGEKYRVGVVVVFFNTETYAKLASGDVDEVKDVTLDDARVEEIWPAIFDAPSPFIRDRFLRQVLGIDSRTRLHEFGRED